MNELSIIEEVHLEQIPKIDDGAVDKSEDSGLASISDSSNQSGKTHSDRGPIIIQFQALNAKPANTRESTFVHGEDRQVGSCNISGIENDAGTQTVNSEDGKSESLSRNDEMTHFHLLRLL